MGDLDQEAAKTRNQPTDEAAADPGTKVITGHLRHRRWREITRSSGALVLDAGHSVAGCGVHTLFLLGVETIETLSGGGYGKAVIHADYTRSLIGALILSAAFGAVAWWRW